MVSGWAYVQSENTKQNKILKFYKVFCLFFNNKQKNVHTKY